MPQTADQHAGEAMRSANQAGDTARRTAGVGSLRGVVTNIDDYKLQTSVTVPFRFNQYDADRRRQDGSR